MSQTPGIGTHGDETILRIPGLRRPLTLLHITDSHLANVDARDATNVPTGTKMHDHFTSLSPEGLDPNTNFQQTLALIRKYAVDYVILTGDIIHFPSAANLEAMDEALSSLSVPYLYTFGNHDWQFPGTEESEANRASVYPRFDRFTHGMPAAQVRDIGGVRLVALDNSTYQLSAEQLAFLQAQLADGVPTLLFIHIPIAIPSLTSAVVAKWDAPIMMAATGWTDDAQAAWNVRIADASTTAAHEFLTPAPPAALRAIFCGHVHFPHADAFGPTQKQYVTRPGFEGGFRLIRLVSDT